ncbi:MAG: hypothetical protein BRD52_08055 [Bacteroidetes bacterium SW_4_67_19]|jgi:hypothetical protein|nr:MAG: hypothetical protein BRD52_08055 [Bacteroidetes bacterium SW_4_67_19]
MPASFDADQFTQVLLAEALFYDEEYGALGHLGLIDEEARRERYLASFMPEDGSFIIEEATAWEDRAPDDEDEGIGYALATDSDEYAHYPVPEQAAEALLSLAREHTLQPSLTLLFEDEGG